MADIAAVFHWAPGVMDAMTIVELMHWRKRAVARWNHMQGQSGD